MTKKFLPTLVVGSVLLLCAIALGTLPYDSDLAPMRAPYRAVPPSIFSLDEITWTVGANMPTARYSGVTGTYGGEVFVAMGRQSDSSPYNTAIVEAYNYTTNTWRTNCQAGPTARRMAAFGAMYQDSLLFVIGGRDNSSATMGTNEIYHMNSNTWTTGRQCNGRWAHGGAVLNGYVYVFGSSGTPAPNTSAQRYDIATDQWTNIADMPSGDGWVCGAAAAGKVYCIGGASNTTAMREYDPASNTWTLRIPCPHTRQYSTAIGHNGLVYVAGGDGSNNLVDVFDPATNTWSAETNLPGNISWSQMGESENAIYVIGGTPQSTPVQYQNQTWIGGLAAPEYGNLEGTVTEAASGDPIEGAYVVLNGDTTLTNASGDYSFTDVQVGTYTVTASMMGYNSSSEQVQILAGQTVTQDFELTQPLISVDIDEINISLDAGETHNETFNISNLGDGDLTYNIEVQEGGGGPGELAILVVDDDGGPNNGGTYQDVQAAFFDALDDAGYDYDTFIVDWSAPATPQNGPDATEMSEYDLVIWFTGETWGYYGDDTLTGADEGSLRTYLNAGGNLFLSAQDYLWDIYPSAGAFSVGQFPYDMLGLRSATQDNWFPPTSCTGGASSFAAGMNFACTVPYPSATLWCDQIQGVGNVLLTAHGSAPDGPAAQQYEGANFKAAFTTLSFEGLVDGTPPSTKAQFMENLISWIQGRSAQTIHSPSRPALAPIASANPAAKTCDNPNGGIDSGTPNYSGPINNRYYQPLETDDPWLAVTPVQGSIPSGGSEMITATFTMPDTAEVGYQYEGSIIIHNNSVLDPVTIPVTVTIVEGVSDKEQAVPMQFALHQNYPNPFNPSTEIRFDLPQTAPVTLAIYNLLGQKVATVLDQRMEAGSHQVLFDASGLASGVYFYRINAGQFTDMKKMVLIK
jgi:hypothetical protein